MVRHGNYKGRAPVNIANRRFGRCIAICLTGGKKGTNLEWLCRCDCGNEFISTEANLMRGDTKSCGCLYREQVIKNITRDLVDGTKVSALSAKLRSNNTSGYKGVSYDKKHGQWYAYITFKKHMYGLGYYDKLEDAVVVRQQAEKKFYQPIISGYEQQSKTMVEE